MDEIWATEYALVGHGTIPTYDDNLKGSLHELQKTNQTNLTTTQKTHAASNKNNHILSKTHNVSATNNIVFESLEFLPIDQPPTIGFLPLLLTIDPCNHIHRNDNKGKTDGVGSDESHLLNAKHDRITTTNDVYGFGKEVKQILRFLPSSSSSSSSSSSTSLERRSIKLAEREKSVVKRERDALDEYGSSSDGENSSSRESFLSDEITLYGSTSSRSA